MTLKQLLAFADRQHGLIAKKFGYETDIDAVLPYAVKLSEEVGELCAEILSSQGYQRQHKLDTYDKEHLAGEIADVIIVACIIARVTGVSVEDALARKMDVVRNRQ